MIDSPSPDPVDPYAFAPESHGAQAQEAMEHDDPRNGFTEHATAHALIQLCREVRALRLTVEMVGDRLAAEVSDLR